MLILLQVVLSKTEEPRDVRNSSEFICVLRDIQMCRRTEEEVVPTVGLPTP